MRNLILAILLLLTAAGFAWNQYQAEIRDLLGLPPIAESEKGNKRRETKEKVVRDEGKLPQEPDGNSGKESPDEDEIQRIVAQRFREVDRQEFSERFTDLSEVPETAFPDRVRINRSLEFAQAIDGRTVAVSHVREGGMARPYQVEEGDVLRLQSLANPSMEARVPIGETDFREQLQSAYELAYSRAEARTREMRSVEASDLRNFRGLLDDWNGKDRLWEFPTEPRFQPIRERIEQRLDTENHRIVGFWEKIVRLEGDLQVVTTALVEGTDLGFGPFQWRVQVRKRRDEIVSITGLPEN